jgi:GNAT superfamily N-acetyltransferase
MKLIEIRAAERSDLIAIAQIIATQNQVPESQCIQSSATTDPQITLSEMQGLFDQDELRFVIAEAAGQIVGCLGCEFERGIGRGWMRGPFLTLPDWEQIPAAMLRELLSSLPPEIRRLDSFLNEKNQRGDQFYLENGFKQTALAHVYMAEKETLESIPENDCSILQVAQVDSFIALHNYAFPVTFIDGKNIVQKIDPNHQVYVHANNETVNGYVYVSIDSYAQEGFIEYLAVQPEQQGKGIGQQLLNCALRWCYFDKGVARVALTVDGKLDNARLFYERAGFRLRYSGVNNRLEY